MTYSYRSFPTFYDVASAKLQAYNRTVTALNISDTIGRNQVNLYLQQFSEPELRNCLTYMLDMDERGAEQVKKDIISELKTKEEAIASLGIVELTDGTTFKSQYYLDPEVGDFNGH